MLARSVEDDTFNPSWRESCAVVLNEGGKLVIEMYDDDVSYSDLMLTYTARGSDDLVSLVVDEDVTLSNDYASLDLTFRPDF